MIASRFGSHGCTRCVNVRCPETCGYQPVITETRLGPHTGCWQNAFPKRTPRAASASKFGVLATAFPKQPNASARS
jgi:hypothetical protein